MFLTILLVAEVAAGSPTPTPFRATTSAFAAPGAANLSSVAGRVKIDRAKADALFQQDEGSSSGCSPSRPDLSVPPSVKKDITDASREAARWHERASRLQKSLASAQADLKREERRFPNAAYGVIASERGEARLLPYRDRVAAVQAAVDALPEECRKAGCQPGWIR